MSLSPGARFGPFEIVSLLGAGGMGEVYRARDTRLDRTVAIKVLPAHLAADPQFQDRFTREARTISQLDHPHICALYDVGEENGTSYLVMQYLEGETLAARLERGALPLADALTVAIQISDALDKAHRIGITHRDLKPGNIMITKSGAARQGSLQAKLLDFGLAKTGPANRLRQGYGGPPKLHAEAEAGHYRGGEAAVVGNRGGEAAVAGSVRLQADLSAVSTTPPNLTAQGTILGTFQYMAPEQLEGREADARTDIFACGAVLYEMATGRRAFEGKSQASLIAAILEHQPPAISSIQPVAPRHLDHLVKRCLAKTPEDRWQAASDLHQELKWIAETVAQGLNKTAETQVAVKRWGRPIPLVATGLISVVAAIAAAAAAWMLKPVAPQASSAIARLTVSLPAGDQIGTLENPALALSPDGAQLVYVGIREGKQQLYLRAIDSLESKVISGTEGAYNPFFSPDGQWVGFFSQGKLKKVSVNAGAIQILCDAPNGGGGQGGSWGPDDSIYFALTNVSGLWKVSASGGTPTQVTMLDRSKGEVSHRWPQVLPGGKAILFAVWTGPGRDERHIHVQSLETGERHVLVQGGDTGRYVSTGHLVYARADALMAVAMDLSGLEVRGAAPVPLAEQVRVGGEGAHYAVSDFGQLVYVPGSPRRFDHRLVWVDRRGNIQPLPAPPREYMNPAISPDGGHAAVEIDAGTDGIWIYDFSRATLSPLTTPNSSSQAPVWTPDGRRVAYRGTRKGFRNLFWKAVDATSEEERLTTRENTSQTPGSWSPDGKWLAFSEVSQSTGSDVWLLHLDGDRKPQTFLATQFDERNPRFSPDGRWLAYTSNESGRFEVYLQPFPGPGAKRLISTEGGTEPVWSRNGRELFYLSGDKFMAVDIATQPTLSSGSPRLLFEGRYEPSPTGSSGYDVSPDGQRFLRIQPIQAEQPATQINVVLNWFEELKQRVGTGK